MQRRQIRGDIELCATSGIKHATVISRRYWIDWRTETRPAVSKLRGGGGCVRAGGKRGSKDRVTLKRHATAQSPRHGSMEEILQKRLTKSVKKKLCPSLP